MSTASIAAVGILVLFAAAGGYALGRSQAPDQEDADVARLEAQRQSRVLTARRSFAVSEAAGRRAGEAEGKDAGGANGADAGERDGSAKSQERLAAIAATDAAATDDGLLRIPSDVTPVDQLPNGEPGYALPEEDRTLSCVGFALDGTCVGD